MELLRPVLKYRSNGLWSKLALIYKKSPLFFGVFLLITKKNINYIECEVYVFSFGKK